MKVRLSHDSTMGFEFGVKVLADAVRSKHVDLEDLGFLASSLLLAVQLHPNLTDEEREILTEAMLIVQAKSGSLLLTYPSEI